ncbi:ribonuclease HII [Campylobacterota bacterium]|nr:ribonuclease HII [Campylobacterota bacterium]
MRLCGIDEAGRGTLAGALAVAGVVLRKPVESLADSKKLTPQKRAELYELIIANSDYHIELIEAATIDDIGLSAAIAYALREIKTHIAADRYLFDGNCTYGVGGIETQVKADASVAEVSAASILAKVSKDRDLLKLAEAYPQYGFEKHQGYGTKAHLAAIAEFGLSPIHRKSFKIRSLA